MNTGIEVTYFEPHTPEEIYNGKIYLDVDGKNYLQFQNDFVKRQFERIKIAFATDIHNNEQYSLMNCSFSHTDFKSYRYHINEIYRGVHLDKVTQENCFSAEARMTYLANWINYPGFKLMISSSIQKPGSITIQKEFKPVFKVDDNISMELCAFCAESYERMSVHLNSIGYIKFSCISPISRLELYRNVSGFLKLLSIFTVTTPKLTALEFTLDSGRVVELLFPKKLKNIKDDSNSLLDYITMELQWQAIIINFYAERNKYVKVLDLLIESLDNKTAEVSFLNITTAFEVFHKCFFEMDIEMQNKLSKELMEHKVLNKRPDGWIQIVRYFHILDRVKDFPFFKSCFTDIYDLLKMMRNSRNYYTHYSKPKIKIWTPNELLYFNRILRQLLKAVILQKVGLSDELINKLLNNCSAYFYHDYEKNEYSINYLSALE